MAENILSIIIPVRNQGRTLGTLLAKLKSYPLPRGWKAEIIAAYSESRDDTLDVLKAHNVRIAHPAAIGPGPARNAAAMEARGQLFYFIDADACPMGDNFLTKLIAIAIKLGRFGAFGGPILLDPSQRRNPIAIGDHWACWFNWSPWRPSQQTRLFQPTVNLVMRRDVFAQVGGFDPRFRVLEDFEFQERIHAHKLPIYFIKGLAVTHHARGSLWRSWRHSWFWGGPFRSAILARGRSHQKLRFPAGSPLFPLNLPAIFIGRMRLILRIAWRCARRDVLIGFPFLAATTLAWALAVVFGPDQPGDKTEAPV